MQIISGDERSLAISNSKQQSQQTPRGESDSVMADTSGELLFKARLQFWSLFGVRGCDLSGFMVFSASGFDKVSAGSLSPQMHKSWFLYGGHGASRPVTRLNQPRFLRAVSRSCDASARTRQWLKECSRSSGVSG